MPLLWFPDILLNMKNVIEQNSLSYLLRPPKVGEIMEGTVAGQGRSALYIDLGPWGTGIVFGREFHAARDLIKGLKKDERIFGKIVEIENDDGYIELSLQAAGKELTWETLRGAKENRSPIKVRVLGANKGGLLAEVSGIQAFLPASQLSAEHYPRVENADQSQILHELQKFVGQELEVHILDLDPREEKLILSEKIKEAEKIKDLLSAYQVGDVVDGEVSGIVDFGAFIRFSPPQDPQNENAKKESLVAAEGNTASIEGLCHISELDWKIVGHPREILKIDQKIKAKIIKIEGDRVFLSLKALKTDPWAEIETQHNKGDFVRGKVTKLNPFGAFVEIAPGIQGLCHISEFGTKEKMEEALSLGQEYEFEILQIDPKEHKMALKPPQAT